MRHKLKGLFLIMGVTLFLLAVGYADCADLAKHTKETETEKQLEFWANVRFRYEYQDNFNVKSYGNPPVVGASDDRFLLGRFRAGFHYYPHANVHISLGMQHSKVWDLALKESDLINAKLDQEHNPYEDSLEPYDTYLEVKEIFSQPLSIKVGRQLIFYGDNRIFGPGQWGNTGRWMWDAVKLSYKSKDGFVDMFYGRTMLHDPDVFSLKHNHGFESFGLYSHVEVPERFLGIEFEPFAMTKTNTKDLYRGEDSQFGNLKSYYMGVRICKIDFKGIDWGFTYIRQDGDYANDDIDAYGYHVLAAYNFDKIPFKPRPGIEYSYASGDSDPADGKHETFDGAFGARDKMYGLMNLFHWMNLKDAQVNLELKPKKWLCLKAEYHQFWLAEAKDAWYLNSSAYRDKTGRAGDKVGREFDLVGKIKLPHGNEIQLGFVHFWPDEFAKNKASDQEATWVFLQWMWKYKCSML